MAFRIAAALGGLILAISAAAPLQAQIRLDRPVGGGGGQQQPQAGGTTATITPEQTIRLLSTAGYTKGQVIKVDDTAMRGTLFDLAGTPVYVFLYACEGNNCGSLQFVTTFGKQDVSLDFINSFNRDRRYARLYQLKDGTLFLTMDTWLSGGVSPAFVTSSGSLFGTMLKLVVEYKPE